MRPALLLPLCLALAACAWLPPGATDPALRGDAARPAAAQAWIRSELYFSVGSEGQPQTQVDEAQWRAFLDREVTPRFPDGLTVFDGYGQWLFRGAAAPERQRAKVLVVLHEDSAARSADIEAIRAAWKRATGHQSVLWSRQRADVSF
ncbi:DUF3574 domain-containing protein [Lysobacter silvisoli]|uniref:DUF3574 domain-containing protein n=1 Tax=Lysobacter silvisoli TaxID=2293254 RepID=A0A371K6J8_9GAMM|nr:DUF3574 domain-containing protein [Lysobacter silvisoli]RDZ29583.1 DUF3574 domain-containing protein [Lysobacter silvisoli]